MVTFKQSKAKQSKAKLLTLSLTFLFISVTFCHADLRHGLVGWWKFDELSGNAIDSSGQGNTGTPTGTTIVSNCKRGGCRSFNGSSEYVTIDHSTPLNLGGTADNYTMSLWFKTSAGQATQAVLLAKFDATASSTTDVLPMFIDLSASVAGQVRAALRDDDGTFRAISSNSSVYNDNKWHHAACVINPVNGNISLYIDNSDIKTQATNINASTVNAAAIYLGVINNDGSLIAYLNGQIDDVRIYNRALSAQEVKDLYVSGTRIGSGKIGSGKFNF